MPISDIMNSGDLSRRVTDVEKRLREITSGRRLEDASVGARGIQILGGGNLTVDGGTVKLISSLGVTLAEFGPNASGNPEWRLYYDNGTVALHLQGAANDQFVAIRDRSGNIVFSTDTLSGSGVARPYVPLRLVPSFDAEITPPSPLPGTTNASATKLWQGINPMWHPRISVGIAMTGSGGTGHWSMEINGETVLADETDGGERTVAVPGWGDDINPGDAVGVDIFGWVENGPGHMALQCDRAFGTQS